MKEKRLESPEITQSFASELAKKIKAGTVIALIGNLGAGKTTFAKGFAKASPLPNLAKSLVAVKSELSQKLYQRDPN